MLALRMMLGLLEAGYFSTAAFLVSTWYIRRMVTPSELNNTDIVSGEVAKRNSSFYLFGSMLGGFGGILAYGVSKLVSRRTKI